LGATWEISLNEERLEGDKFAEVSRGAIENGEFLDARSFIFMALGGNCSHIVDL
jgi:hypothetical protein